MNHVVVVGVVCLLVFGLGTSLLKRYYLAKIARMMSEGNCDTCLALTKSILFRVLFPPFNVDYLRLNALLMKNDKTEIIQQLKKMFKRKMNDQQKEEVAFKALQYFVTEEEKEEATKMLAIIDTSSNTLLKEESHMMYDIFIGKQANHIDTLESSFEKAVGERKKVIAYLLAIQYQNINHMEKYKYYCSFYQ